MRERGMSCAGRSALDGAMAGAAGTAVLVLVEPLETRALGAVPVYASARVAARLAARAGVALTGGAARRAGRLLRWLYGPALGVAWSLLGRRRPGLASWGPFAAAICAFELLALPAVGATPPLRRWPRSQLGMLVLHTSSFAAAVTAVARRLARPR